MLSEATLLVLLFYYIQFIKHFLLPYVLHPYRCRDQPIKQQRYHICYIKLVFLSYKMTLLVGLGSLLDISGSHIHCIENAFDDDMQCTFKNDMQDIYNNDMEDTINNDMQYTFIYDIRYTFDNDMQYTLNNDMQVS